MSEMYWNWIDQEFAATTLEQNSELTLCNGDLEWSHVEYVELHFYDW